MLDSAHREAAPGVGALTTPRAPRSFPIRVHLAFLVLLGAIPGLIAALTLTYTFTQERRREIEGRVVQLSRDLAADLSHELERSLIVLRTLSQSAPLEHGDLEGFHRLAQKAVGPGDAAILLIGKEGDVLVNSRVAWGTPLSAYAQPQALVEALSRRTPAVTGLFYGPTTPIPLINVLLPVVLPDGAEYALASSRTAASIAALLQDQALEPAWATAVSDRDGVLIARSRDHDAFVGRPLSPHLRQADLQDGRPHATTSVDGQQIVRAVAHTRVGGWAVGATVSQDHITRFVWQSLWKLALAALALFGLAAILVRRYSAMLTRAFGDVAAGRDTGAAARVDEAAQAAHIMAQNTAALRFSRHTLAAAADVAGIATWGWDERRQTKLWSPEAKAIFGLAPATQVTSELFQSLLHPDDLPRYRAAWAAAMAGDGRYALEYRIARQNDGAERWIQSRAQAEFDHGGVVQVIGALRDITDERHAQMALARSEVRLRTALATAQAGVWSFNLDTGAGEWDARSMALFGVDAAGAPPTFQRWVADLLAPASATQMRDLMAAGDANMALELEARPPGGDTRWLLTNVRVEREGAGARTLLGVSLDISDRKRHEQHVAMLMREVNHRSKNLLAVVGSIARQTARTQKRDYVPALLDRITALSACQDLLVHNDFTGVRLRDLVAAQLKPFDDAEHRVSAQGPDLLLNAAAAQTLSLALHELGANAAKHGALSRDWGVVHLHWAIDGADFVMTWVESGGPAPVPGAKGFGSTVLTTMTEMGAKGQVHLEMPEAGLRWRLRAPMSALTDA